MHPDPRTHRFSRRAALPAAWVASLMGALAAGCAAPAGPLPAAPPSAPAVPPGTPSARLLLRGAVAPQDGYAIYMLADALACKRPALLVAGTPQKAPEPVSLAAGKLTTLDFTILRGGKPSCGVRWSFTPLAGKTYLMQGLAVGGGCSARLVDASAPDRPQLPADAALRSGSGQTCLPLDQARAATVGRSSIQGGQQRGEAVLNPRASAGDLQGLISP